MPHIEYPTNLRLGHLVERFISCLIRSSDNYTILYENIQIIENKQTIGELDFILIENETKEMIHVEFAYKFYLYDPSISNIAMNNWIGPNRNDSLHKKIQKTKNKQFPLLYHSATRSTLSEIDINRILQKSCLLVSLYIPFNHTESFKPNIKKAICGYYLSIDTFKALDHTGSSYYLPKKTEWGLDPEIRDSWLNVNEFLDLVEVFLLDKKAPLCWVNKSNTYSSFFIVWW